MTILHNTSVVGELIRYNESLNYRVKNLFTKLQYNGTTYEGYDINFLKLGGSGFVDFFSLRYLIIVMSMRSLSIFRIMSMMSMMSVMSVMSVMSIIISMTNMMHITSMSAVSMMSIDQYDKLNSCDEYDEVGA